MSSLDKYSDGSRNLSGLLRMWFRLVLPPELLSSVQRRHFGVHSTAQFLEAVR